MNSTAKVLTSTMISLFLFSCAQKEIVIEPPPKEKQSIIFIHGAYMDAKVWNTILPEFQGIDVWALTLKGRMPKENFGLTEMATDACTNVPKPSVLVVHSFGGAVANQMVGICPEKIQRIIYVTALVPLRTEKAFDSMAKVSKKVFAKAVKFSKMRMTPKSKEKLLTTMDAGVDPKNFPDVEVHSESLASGKDLIGFDVNFYEQLPKCYIYTTQDKLVPLDVQQSFTTRTPMQKTESIDSGHLPMLSKPKELAVAIKNCLQ